MPKITLPSKQASGEPNWVEIMDLDDLMGEDILIIRRAAKITQGAGETTFAPKEMEDDTANAFLGRTITAWSFAAPIPSQNSLAAADVAITRVMKGRDYIALRKAVKPMVKEIDDFEAQDPKSSQSSQGS